MAKAMDVDPARRYSTAAALAEDLARVLDRRPIVARRSSALLRGRRAPQELEDLVGPEPVPGAHQRHALRELRRLLHAGRDSA